MRSALKNPVVSGEAGALIALENQGQDDEDQDRQRHEGDIEHHTPPRCGNRSSPIGAHSDVRAARPHGFLTASRPFLTRP